MTDINENECEDDEELCSASEYYGDCGLSVVGDHCQQCGLPLCPMCFETGAEFCKNHPDENYDDAWQEDAYGDLRNATPEQLLEAATWFLRQSTSPPVEVEVAISYLREGFDLARPGGWERIAPMWLRESRRIAALDE